MLQALQGAQAREGITVNRARVEEMLRVYFDFVDYAMSVSERESMTAASWLIPVFGPRTLPTPSATRMWKSPAAGLAFSLGRNRSARRGLEVTRS
jgi:hypothetical protein